MEKHKIGTNFLPEHYEGFLHPRTGPAPYKIIDDPEIIKRKNEMRSVLREEYFRKLYNPYRRASGLPGRLIDTAWLRYEACQRTFPEYVRPGPKITFSLLVLYVAVPYLIYKYKYNHYVKTCLQFRSGNVAYEDRPVKFIY